MAIEAIGNKNVAYQGSLSQSEPATDKVVKTERNVVRGENVQIIKEQNVKTDMEDVDVEKEKEKGQALDQNSQIQKVVDEINKSASGMQTEVIFGIHDDTNRVTIKIVDKKSKQVIKEFPPEKTLDMIAKVWEMAGIMVDEKR